MKNRNTADEVTHLQANYWLLTLLSGIFLGLLALSLFNAWALGYIIAYGGLFAVCVTYALKIYAQKKQCANRMVEKRRSR